MGTWEDRGKSEQGGSFNNAGTDAVFCACEWGYFGEECEKVKCPGIGKVMYKDVCTENGEQVRCDGVCSNHGDGFQLNSGCHTSTGQCMKCGRKYHSFGGKVQKCQFTYCPYIGRNANEEYRLPEGSRACQAVWRWKDGAWDLRPTQWALQLR